MKHNDFSSILVSKDTESVSQFEQWLGSNQNLVIHKSFGIIQEAYKYAQEIFPDLMFIDLDYETSAALNLLRKLRLHYSDTFFIVLASDDRFAHSAIKENVFDYLIKPVLPNDIDSAYFRIQENIQKKDVLYRIKAIEKLLISQRKLSFNTRCETIVVKPDDIFYIEADCNYSEIYFSKTKSKLVSTNIGSMLNQLPVQFARINRSVIINTDYLVKISSGSRVCYLSKDNEIIDFTIPEKQIASLKRTLFHVGERIQHATLKSSK